MARESTPFWSASACAIAAALFAGCAAAPPPPGPTAAPIDAPPGAAATLPVRPASVARSSGERAVQILPESDPLTIGPPPVGSVAERGPRPADPAGRVAELLRRSGAAWSDKLPADRRLSADVAIDLLPASAAQAWREYRKAWLQDDAEAGFALIGESTRKMIAATVQDWRRRAARDGVPALAARLREAGLPHHAGRVERAGVDGYGVRAWFDAAWEAEHADFRRVREALNSRDDGVRAAAEGVAAVRVEFVGALTDDVREGAVRVVRESDGVWRVEPELR